MKKLIYVLALIMLYSCDIFSAEDDQGVDKYRYGVENVVEGLTINYDSIGEVRTVVADTSTASVVNFDVATDTPMVEIVNTTDSKITVVGYISPLGSPENYIVNIESNLDPGQDLTITRDNF